MEKIIQTNLAPEELDELIQKAVSKGLEGKTVFQDATETEERGEYGTRRGVARHCHISLPTLDMHLNNGTLIRHQIGNRILIRWDEVEAAISAGVLGKHRRS